MQEPAPGWSGRADEKLLCSGLGLLNLKAKTPGPVDNPLGTISQPLKEIRRIRFDLPAPYYC